MYVTKLYKLPEVLKIVRLGKTSLYARLKCGDFPPPVKLGGGRSIAWKSTDIEEWIRTLPVVENYGEEIK